MNLIFGLWLNNGIHHGCGGYGGGLHFLKIKKAPSKLLKALTL